MKKKKPVKKKISKSEKSLREKLKYQQILFRKERTAIQNIYSEFKPLEVISTQTVNKKQKNGKYKKVSYEFTTENAISPHQNKMLKITKQKEILYKKLERYKFKPKGNLEKSLERFKVGDEELGRAWENKNILKRLLGGIEFHNINGFDLKTETYEIVNLVNFFNTEKMDSETVLMFRELDFGVIEMYVTKDEEAKEQIHEL